MQSPGPHLEFNTFMERQLRSSLHDVSIYRAPPPQVIASTAPAGGSLADLRSKQPASTSIGRGPDMQVTMIGDTEIRTDGRTVWVNGPAGCLARFGGAGYEIGSAAPYFEGSPWNEPGLQWPERWALFVARVKARYGIAVPDSHKPKFLKGT